LNTNKQRSLLPLFLIIFVDAVGLGLIFPVLTPIFINNSLHLFSIYTPNTTRYLLYAIILSAYPFAMFLGAPCLGSASDKYGRKPIFLLSLLGNSIGLLLTAVGIIYTTFSIILIGRLISGLTAGSFPIAQAAIIDTYEAANKSIGMSFITAANAIGFAVGPSIGALFSDQTLATWLTPSMPFFITAIMPLAAALLIQYGFKETYCGNPNQAIYWYSGLLNIYEAFKITNTRYLIISLSLFLLGYFGFFNYLSIYVIQFYHFTAMRNGLFLTCFSLWFTIALLFITPWLTKNFNLYKILIGSLILQISGLLLIILVKYSWAGWLALAPLAIGVSSAYVTLLTLLSNNTEINYQGKIMGVAASMMALAWAVAPLLSGIIESIALKLPLLFSLFILIGALIMTLKFKQISASHNKI
jgi:MFS family permease